MLRSCILALTLVFVGCSDDEVAPPPASTTDTGSALPDTNVADTNVADTNVADTNVADTNVEDANIADSTVADSGASTDAVTWDTAGACHSFGFGAPAATIMSVSSLPTMTGGTIVNGVYDAVAVQTTGGTMGSYRATWSFVADMKIEAIEQLAISSTPPPPVPRVLSWSTSGTSLTRTQVCGGTASFTNQYTVRTESTGTFLDIRQDTVMFTFKKR